MRNQCRTIPGISVQTHIEMGSKQIFDYLAILDETLVELAQAPKYYPVKIHRASLERYVRKGKRGVRLETALLGNKRYTSVEAIRRFLLAQLRLAPDESEPQRDSMSKRALAEASKRFGLPEPHKIDMTSK
jgi:hypothetical protein